MLIHNIGDGCNSVTFVRCTCIVMAYYIVMAYIY